MTLGESAGLVAALADLRLDVVALVFAPLIVGAYGHELTHWLVGKAVGAEVRLYPIALHVEYALPDDDPLWKDRAITLAPAALGWTLAGGYLAIYGLPAITLTTICIGIGWAIYATGGGLEDYSLVRSHGGSVLRDVVGIDTSEMQPYARSLLRDSVITLAILAAVKSTVLLYPHVGPTTQMFIGSVNSALLHVIIAMSVIVFLPPDTPQKLYTQLSDP